ncbi:MAG: ABC transporter substrate-binding protein [candidate division Zixibacteria bacterium]|nr:ABC transporter substrate-binding protein [candidate division Zixibacteria bacterium]
MFDSATPKKAEGFRSRFQRLRNGILLAVAILLALPALSLGQTTPGKVIFLKENRLYVDWDKSSGVRKGKTVFILSGPETLGTATVAWAFDDLTMVEMATGFARLSGLSREALSVLPEAEKGVVRGAGYAVGMATPLEIDWTKKIPAPDNWALLACLYEGLVAEPEEGHFRPLLADSFRIGGRWIIFYVKSGLSFHSGRRLTAYEIKKVLDANLAVRMPEFVRWASLLAPRAAWPKRFPPLSSPIEARDTGTLIIHLRNYTPLALSYLASPLGWVKDLSDTLARFPAGSGPFRVEAIRPGAVRLVRNRRYHGPAPQADTLNFRWFTRREESDAAFRKGELSLVWFKSGELPQTLRFDPDFGGKELCFVSTWKRVFTFFLRPVTADSSRMLASGAAYSAGNIGTELYRGDWLPENSPAAEPDSFKISFLVDRELDSTGLLPAFLSTSRLDLPLFEMQLSQIETFIPAQEVRLAALLTKLKDHTGSRQVDSLSTVLGRVWFSPAREKEPILAGIEKFLADRFGLAFLYRPAMTLLARPELSGFSCSSFPNYRVLSKKTAVMGNR